MPKPATTKAPKASNGVTMKQVNAAIASMTKSSQAFGLAATSAAMIALMHCNQHGDATGLQRLHAALGATGQRVGPQRQKALMAWLKAYSPVRMNNKTKDFGLLKSDKPNFVAFNLDDAESTPFLDFIPENGRTATAVSNASIAKRIATAIKKDYDEGKWEGPAADIETIIGLVRVLLTEA